MFFRKQENIYCSSQQSGAKETSCHEKQFKHIFDGMASGNFSEIAFKFKNPRVSKNFMFKFLYKKKCVQLMHQFCIFRINNLYDNSIGPPTKEGKETRGVCRYFVLF